jgi:hypothetical protein
MTILQRIINAIKALFGSAPMPAEALGVILDKKAAAAGEPLDWRNSIVDLMKLVGMDSSLQARDALAAELGYPGPYNGSAEMNTWLHQQVMAKLEASWSGK